MLLPRYQGQAERDVSSHDVIGISVGPLVLGQDGGKVLVSSCRGLFLISIGHRDGKR